MTEELMPEAPPPQTTEPTPAAEIAAKPQAPPPQETTDEPTLGDWLDVTLDLVGMAVLGSAIGFFVSCLFRRK